MTCLYGILNDNRFYFFEKEDPELDTAFQAINKAFTAILTEKVTIGDNKNAIAELIALFINIYDRNIVSFPTNVV